MDQLPATIHTGMDVYDRDDNKIGSVEDFKFADAEAVSAQGQTAGRDDSLIDNLADALWPKDMPEAQRARLLQSGYVLLDAKGLLHKDRFVLPEQIASASDDRIVLNVRRDDLQKADAPVR